MKRFLLFFAVLTGLFSLSSIFPNKSYASEGLVEIRSQTRDSYRCYASSFLMQDSSYTILVSCRDLIYPANDAIFSYVLWATPRDGGNPIRLGDLGFGRFSTRITIPFTSLFVTTEANPAVGLPTGPVVMRGNLQRITFLDRETTATPTPRLTGTNQGNGTPNTPDEEVTPTPEGEQPVSTGEKLMTALRRAGLAAFLAFVALIGLVFAITKARG